MWLYVGKWKMGFKPNFKAFQVSANAYEFCSDFLDFEGNLPLNNLRQKNDGEYVAGIDL